MGLASPEQQKQENSVRSLFLSRPEFLQEDESQALFVGISEDQAPILSPSVDQTLALQLGKNLLCVSANPWMY